jgi:hypothetical protein
MKETPTFAIHFMLFAFMKYLQNGIEMKINFGFCEKIYIGEKELRAVSSKFVVSVIIFSLQRNFTKLRGK